MAIAKPVIEKKPTFRSRRSHLVYPFIVSLQLVRDVRSITGALRAMSYDLPHHAGQRPRRHPARRPGPVCRRRCPGMGCLAGARQVAEPLNPFGSDVEVQMLDVLNDHLGPGIRGLPRRQLGHDQRDLLVDLLRGGRDDDVMGSSQFHQALHPAVGAEDDVDMTLGGRVRDDLVRLHVWEG